MVAENAENVLSLAYKNTSDANDYNDSARLSAIWRKIILAKKDDGVNFLFTDVEYCSILTGFGKDGIKRLLSVRCMDPSNESINVSCFFFIQCVEIISV